MEHTDKRANDLLEEAQKPIPLSRVFTFWFSFAPNKAIVTREDYESENKILGSMSTVEEFWAYYQHMVRPDKLPIGSKFALFQEGIKPAWEDKENQGGGCFILKVKKNYANKFWEDLLISYIGEQCEDNDEICGMILNVKSTEINISLWTRALDDESKDSIEDWIRKTLGFHDKMTVQYRHHPRNKGESHQHSSHPHPSSHGGRGETSGPRGPGGGERKIERNDEAKRREGEGPN